MNAIEVNLTRPLQNDVVRRKTVWLIATLMLRKSKFETKVRPLANGFARQRVRLKRDSVSPALHAFQQR